MASGLVSTTLVAHFALGFPAASSLKGLNLAAPTDSRTHSSTGTLSPSKGLQPLCRYMVSGSFNSGPSGSFHRSLALLVRYRSLSSI